MNIARLKVITRLGMSFGAAVALMAGMAAVGLTRLATVSDDVDTLASGQVPALVLMSSMATAAGDTMRRLQHVMQRENSEEIRHAMEEARVESTDRSARIEKLRILLESTPAWPGFARLVEAHGILLDAEKRLFTADAADVRDIYQNLLRQRQATYANVLEEMVTSETQVVRGAGAHARATYQSGRALIVGLGLSAALISIIASWYITRTLLLQLGGEPRYAAEVAERIAEGDLSVEINIKPGDRSSLLWAMKRMQDRLAGIVGQVRRGTDAIALASDDIASGNGDLSRRTESQASFLGAATVSMGELTERVRDNHANADNAVQLAAKAVAVAVEGGQVVSRMIDTIAEISKSARRIGDINAVIDGIAFQTNILALNAAVEASRAGEAGRGFAVVAAEVRVLAQRSAVAAREIKELIGTSTAQVTLGSALAADADGSMRNIVESIGRVRDLMHEMLQASSREAEKIVQIHGAVSQMDAATQQNAAMVEQAAAAAKCLHEQAGRLARDVSVFKLGDDADTDCFDADKSQTTPHVVVGLLH